MKVLVTGANGFTGTWLLRALLARGHEVTGAEGVETSPAGLEPDERDRVSWAALDLLDPDSVRQVADRAVEAVVHLAAASSVGESLVDPVRTWEVNALGTVRLLEALADVRLRERIDPVVLVVSTAEVYGPGLGGPRPRVETDRHRPVSPYAASKAAAELAALDCHRRTGLRTMVVRPFPHTGPGQSTRFVAPAFADRILLARKIGAPVVETGNLETVRDLLDVRDVAEAYCDLLERGEPGQTYNVAGGSGISMRDLFFRLADLAGHRVAPDPDASLTRAADIPHLVGDATKLCDATGWAPRRSLDETLRDLLDAQAN